MGMEREGRERERRERFFIFIFCPSPTWKGQQGKKPLLLSLLLSERHRRRRCSFPGDLQQELLVGGCVLPEEESVGRPDSGGSGRTFLLLSAVAVAVARLALPHFSLSRNPHIPHAQPPTTTKAHKHTALSLRPGKLVSSGLFSHSRNPNYLGELLTYLTLAGLPACALRSLLPLLPLCASLLLEWIPNMKQKDASLKRHGALWEEWAVRAPFLFPWRAAVEAAKEAVRVSEGVVREGCWSGQEKAEGENEKKEENEEERGESETPVLTAAAAKNSKGRRGRRGSSARKRGAVAAGRR